MIQTKPLAMLLRITRETARVVSLTELGFGMITRGGTSGNR